MSITRQIIQIDEDLCNGCGQCVPSCQERAIEIVETPNGLKARLVKEIFCDGLGACLGTCPTGALTITERAAEAYDEVATHAHIQRLTEAKPAPQSHVRAHGGGCPSSRTLQWKTAAPAPQAEAVPVAPRSELRQWPVQLHLVSPQAPYFKGAELVLAADCVPFAYANFHQEFLRGDGKALAIGCPKLDDTGAYRQKLTQLFALSTPASVTIVNMEVPCCFGLGRFVEEAIAQAGVDIPVNIITISIRGERLT